MREQRWHRRGGEGDSSEGGNCPTRRTETGLSTEFGDPALCAVQHLLLHNVIINMTLRIHVIKRLLSRKASSSTTNSRKAVRFSGSRSDVDGVVVTCVFVLADTRLPHRRR